MLAYRGMIFGGLSIILFFLSFGIGIREKSKDNNHIAHSRWSNYWDVGLRGSSNGQGRIDNNSKFVLGCSHSWLYHNGIRYIQIGSERMNTLGSAYTVFFSSTFFTIVSTGRNFSPKLRLIC